MCSYELIVTLVMGIQYINRIGNKLSLGSKKVRLKSSLVEELLLLFKVDNHHQIGEATLKVATIDMNEGDGLTTSSRELIRRIKSEYSTYSIYQLSNDAKSFHSLPSIAYVLGLNTFMKYAVKHNLATGYLRVFGVKKIFIVLFSIIVGLFGTLLTQYFKNFSKEIDDDFLSIFSQPQIYISATLISLLLLLGKFLTERYSFSTESKSISEFKKVLSESGSGEFNELINNLIDDLVLAYSRMSKPRVMIVDNYSRLDKLSKRVIVNYIDHYLDQNIRYRGKELIISFETKENTDKLGVRLLFKLRKGGSSNDFVTFYDIDNITQKQKESLVTELGVDDERLKYSVLTSIVGAPKPIDYDFIKSIYDRSTLDKACFAFAHFLALSSIPSKQVFSKKTIIDLVGFNHVREYIQLSSDMSYDEFADYFFSNFSSFYHFNTSNLKKDNLFVYINDAARASFDEYGARLGLPSKSVGHAIWVLVKFQYIEKQADKLYWFISIKNHFVRSTPKDFQLFIDNSLADQVLKALKDSIAVSISNG
ncbi:MAG: hypothetical protein AAFY76_01240, partial [Cyanobacteria bacterium J06649_11]